MNTLVRINWIARGSLAFMFAYHGLVPKLLWLSRGERTMIQAHGIQQVQVFATLAGVGEIVLALWILLSPRSAWPIAVAAAALAGLLVDVAVFSPAMLREAFNPVSLNVAGLALCAVAWNTKP
ncbi:DoxX-like family protein [Pseudomonas sp. A4002]|uniref:DoxX-like family protein n=1 Tax=unclassified Pseudomonas TaxID=196821 RepID=UPI0015A3B613|nr:MULTISPECIES: DoxX-like family protein [unclassified Pseudomonas]NVZ36080.1 DoxX-like family protein [Pseudomonas sp. A4002]NWB83091.1 DoxX-like family protein [Pseudomonas sp. F9001]